MHGDVWEKNGNVSFTLHRYDSLWKNIPRNEKEVKDKFRSTKFEYIV